MGVKPSRSDAQWAEAKKKCRLNTETVRMAKELGLNPRKLIKNRPNPSQPWKGPVHEWIRELYHERQQMAAETAAKKAAARGLAPPGVPVDVEPPSAPEVSPVSVEDRFPREARFQEDLDEDLGAFWSADRRPGAVEIEEQNQAMLRRQAVFRQAAERVAEAIAEFPAVRKVALFGSVAVPLEKEVPRFRKFRRHRIAVFHECADVDLAVWVDDAENLRPLGKARSRAVNRLVEEIGGGVAHHQVEIFLLEAATGRHLGRLCSFAKCPKGKVDCLTEGCGQPAFVKQIPEFQLWPDALAPERTVVLFERWAGEPAGDDVPF